MEIGIPRGRFQVIRVHPNADAPEGAFVVRIQDSDSGIVIVTTLTTEDGLRLAGGFHTAGEAEATAPVVALPDAADRKVFGGEGRGEALEQEPPAAGEVSEETGG